MKKRGKASSNAHIKQENKIQTIVVNLIADFTLSLAYMKLDFRLVKEICALGLAGFIMAITNGSVQIVCNATLSG